MPVELRDGSVVEDPRLDRLPEPDPRDRMFGVCEVIGGQERPVSTRWAIPDGSEVLNQGKEGACFTSDVLIRMADGSQRPISEVRLLDEVATAEGRTGVVTQLMVRPANRGLVRVTVSGHLPLRCTPEHPILTERGYVAAEDLVVGDKIAITRYAAGADDPIRPLELVDLRELRGVLSGEVNTGGVVTTVAPLPEFLARTPALGRLLGLYAAEGYTTANKVVWCFADTERDTLASEVQALVKTVFDAPARIQDRTGSRAINVVLYGKAWRRLFEVLVPGTARHGTKALSGYVSHGSTEYLRALFDGWLAGDGHRRRTEHSGVTVCRALALDMHAIATALGLRPRLNESEPSINRHAATRQTRYEVAFGTGGGSNRSARQDDAAVWRAVRAVEPEPFEGHVYNMEVEGDHSYIADGVGVHNCVGYGVTNELRFNPVPVLDLGTTFARESIYWAAQKIDPWPGGSYPGASPRYEGTSVRAGVKIAARLGYVGEYRWAFNESEMALAITLGPIIIGVDWYEGMYRPDSRGYLRPTGRKVGGHCCLVVGLKVTGATTGYYTIYNSWGPNWGVNGTARITRADMHQLKSDGGDACLITQRFNPPQPR